MTIGETWISDTPKFQIGDVVRIYNLDPEVFAGLGRLYGVTSDTRYEITAIIDGVGHDSISYRLKTDEKEFTISEGLITHA